MHGCHLNLVAPFDDVRNSFGHHANAVDDWTHGQTQIASRAIIGDIGQVRFGIEFDGLIARVSARHVALAAVDAEVLLNKIVFI